MNKLISPIILIVAVVVVAAVLLGGNDTTPKPPTNLPEVPVPELPIEPEVPVEPKPPTEPVNPKPPEPPVVPIEPELPIEPTEPITITYNHPSGAGESEQDCFDDSKEICITRGLTRAPYNAGSLGDDTIEWGCGSCDDVSAWYPDLNTNFKDSCIGTKMHHITSQDVCLKTPEGLWDVDFSEFQSGGGGGFAYTRTQFLE